MFYYLAILATVLDRHILFLTTIRKVARIAVYELTEAFPEAL